MCSPAGRMFVPYKIEKACRSRRSSTSLGVCSRVGFKMTLGIVVAGNTHLAAEEGRFGGEVLLYMHWAAVSDGCQTAIDLNNGQGFAISPTWCIRKEGKGGSKKFEPQGVDGESTCAQGGGGIMTRCTHFFFGKEGKNPN